MRLRPVPSVAPSAKVGIDLDAVTRQLEDEGIASFTKSFEQLLAGVEAKKEQVAEVVGVA